MFAKRVLILIDGVEGDIATINPEDIESGKKVNLPYYRIYIEKWM